LKFDSVSGQTHKKASQFAIGLLASLQFAQRSTTIARAITNLIFTGFKLAAVSLEKRFRRMSIVARRSLVIRFL
jgi:hypothetical protein